MKSEELSLEELNNIVPYLKLYKYKPYFYYKKYFSDNNLSSYFISILENKIQNNNCTVLYFTEDSFPCGLVIVQNLVVESKTFGFNTASIDYLIKIETNRIDNHIEKVLLEKTIDFCNDQRINHLSIRVNANDYSLIHALNKNGFFLVDGIISYSKDLEFRNWMLSKDMQFEIRNAEGKDLHDIKLLAGSSFSHDKLHNDPWISEKNANEIHEIWIENSLSNNEDIVLIAIDNQEILGYSVFRVNNSTKDILGESIGTWVIAATSKKSKGKGVAQNLCLSMFDIFHQKGIKIVEGGTQLTNIASARLHESCDFRIINTSLSFSRWL